MHSDDTNPLCEHTGGAAKFKLDNILRRGV